MDDKDKHFVSELLEATLRNYAGPEQRTGLEGRVLAVVRVRQQAARRRLAWAWCAGLAGLTAAVALLVICRPHRQAPPAATAGAGVSLPARPVAKAASPPRPPLPHAALRHATSRRVDNRPQQFPTPHPFSEQERLLIAYTEALQTSAASPAPEANQEFEHELEIPQLNIVAIKIKPLAPIASGGEK